PTTRVCGRVRPSLPPGKTNSTFPVDRNLPRRQEMSRAISSNRRFEARYITIGRVQDPDKGATLYREGMRATNSRMRPEPRDTGCCAEPAPPPRLNRNSARGMGKGDRVFLPEAYPQSFSDRLSEQ